MSGDERNALGSGKYVWPAVEFLLNEIRNTHDFVDLLHRGKGFFEGGEREDVVLLATLTEQRPGSDKTCDIGHFGPVEDSRDVIVHAMRKREDAVTPEIE